MSAEEKVLSKMEPENWYSQLALKTSRQTLNKLVAAKKIKQRFIDTNKFATIGNREYSLRS